MAPSRTDHQTGHMLRQVVSLYAPMTVLVLLLALAPTRAWPREQGSPHLRPSVTRQDVTQLQEESAPGENLPTPKGQGATSAGGEHSWTNSVIRRVLDDNGSEGDQLENDRQDHEDRPSVEGETRSTVDLRELESKRRYLNSLVQATAMETNDQVSNVAFVKTHKTASTTLAAIMYRYAVRHNLELSHFGHSTSTDLKSAAAQGKTKISGHSRGGTNVSGHSTVEEERMLKYPPAILERQRHLVDVMHYHISPKGQFKGNWNEAAMYYRGIMRHPNRINFVTVLREPRSHLLSYYYYYIQPRNQLSIEEFLMKPAHPNDEDHGLLVNPLSAEFGVRTAEDMDSLIKDTLPDFKLIMLTERLDEGLLVLRRMLRWKTIDVTYCDLNETKAGSRRWDGKPFVDRPHFDDLPAKVQEKIDSLTSLDRVLYKAGVKEFEKRLAPYADSVRQENVKFQELQSIIQEYLEGNTSSLAKPMYESMNVYQETPHSYPF